jgi:hypothetical protein
MTIEEQIGKLKVQGVNTTDSDMILEIIDKLGTYGNSEYRTRAIDAILFIVNTKTDKDIKAHALDIIREIKERKL